MDPMKTFYQKKVLKKLTWIFPNGILINMIDYILSKKKSIVQNVAVNNSISIENNHRLLRAIIKINTRRWKRLLKNKTLLQLNKIFIKTITNRWTSKFETCQLVEQTGFRKGYSTYNHFQTPQTLIKKSINTIFSYT